MADKISPKTLSEIENLLNLTPAKELKDSLITVFFYLITNVEARDLPENFKEISTDIYILLQFLQDVENSTI